MTGRENRRAKGVLLRPSDDGLRGTGKGLEHRETQICVRGRAIGNGQVERRISINDLKFKNVWIIAMAWMDADIGDICFAGWPERF